MKKCIIAFDDVVYHEKLLQFVHFLENQFLQVAMDLFSLVLFLLVFFLIPWNIKIQTYPKKLQSLILNAF